MESMQFEITNSEGKMIICETIATYHDEDSNKDFIVYTDGTLNEEKKLKLFYSLYKIKDNTIQLIKTMNKEDKKLGLELIKELITD
jgi:hypothetical protein